MPYAPCAKCRATTPRKPDGSCAVCLTPAPAAVRGRMPTVPDLQLAMYPQAAPSNGTATSDAAAQAQTPAMLDARGQAILREMRLHFHPEGAIRQEMEESMKQSGDWIRPGVWTLRNERWLTYKAADGRELPDDSPEAVTRPTKRGRPAAVLYLSAKYWRAVESIREGRAA